MQNKGDKLERLFEEGEKVHQQMRQLFTDNNVSYLELNKLPEATRKEWDELQLMSNNLSEKMCKTILSS